MKGKEPCGFNIFHFNFLFTTVIIKLVYGHQELRGSCPEKLQNRPQWPMPEFGLVLTGSPGSRTSMQHVFLGIVDDRSIQFVQLNK
jgi:hypothetical protein